MNLVATYFIKAGLLDDSTIYLFGDGKMIIVIVQDQHRKCNAFVREF